MCSDQGKVHSPCKVTCPLEKKTREAGNYSWTERLQGKGVHEFLRKGVVSLFPLLVCF